MPDRIIEDVLIRVVKFIILTNFTVMDFDVDRRVSIIDRCERRTSHKEIE